MNKTSFMGTSVKEVFELYDLKNNIENYNKIFKPLIVYGFTEDTIRCVMHNHYEDLISFVNTNTFLDKLKETIIKEIEQNNKDCEYLVNSGTFKNLSDAHDYMDHRTFLYIKDSENKKHLKEIKQDKFTGYIYFIQCNNNKYIKIGYTTNLKTRIQVIQSNNPEKINVLNVINGTERMERKIHRELNKYNIRGEWFLPDDEVIKAMNNYVATYNIDKKLIEKLLS
jgi:hypothetical protein